MDICYPPNTDWSCRWDEETLAEQRADPVMGPKIETAEAFAWSLLASLTLYRIGTCPITVRPCAERCMPPSGTYSTAIARGGNVGALGTVPIGSFNPHITGGAWVNACGCRPGGCECVALSSVILPGPVGSVVDVTLDGVSLDRSAYRVMNGNRLVRTDGQDWPACQDMAAPSAPAYEPIVYRGTGVTVTFTRDEDIVSVLVQPDTGVTPWNIPNTALPWSPTDGASTFAVLRYPNGTAAGTVSINSNGNNMFTAQGGLNALPQTFQYITDSPAAVSPSTGVFEVTYYRGAAPNRMTLAAAGALANEFLLACEGEECRLPYNVTSAARSGESYEFETSDYSEGKTGIPQVDAVIRIFNPNGLRSPVIVASPDDYLTPARTA